MARPIKEGLDYFPHDTDAVNDEKVEALRALHGNDGYAFFFILLERIYRSSNCELIVSDAETIQILARKVAVTEQKFNEMLATALKWDCFNKQIYDKSHILTSNGIKKRASVVLEKRKSMRGLYQKTKLNPSSLPISASETTPETQKEPHKVKERKGKERKGKEKGKESITNPSNNLPNWLSKETWDAFLEMRKAKKDIPTAFGIKLLLGKLEKFKSAGDDPNEVLNRSIMNGWKGIFPLDRQGGQNGAHQSKPGKIPTRYTRPEELLQ